MKNKKVNTKKDLASELKKMKALKQLNEHIDNGHIIRQSMKYHYENIRGWCSISKLSDSTLKITSSKQLGDYLNKLIPITKRFEENFKIAWVRKELFDWIPIHL